jgi:hypothetical protein
VAGCRFEDGGHASGACGVGLDALHVFLKETPDEGSARAAEAFGLLINVLGEAFGDVEGHGPMCAFGRL